MHSIHSGRQAGARPWRKNKVAKSNQPTMSSSLGSAISANCSPSLPPPFGISPHSPPLEPAPAPLILACPVTPWFSLASCDIEPRSPSPLRACALTGPALTLASTHAGELWLATVV